MIRAILKNKGNAVNILLILVSVMAVAGIMVFFFKEVRPQLKNLGSETVQNLSNFSETGYLVINNPGLDKNTWYLSYEKIGQPVIVIKLVFSKNSVCKEKTGKEGECQPSNFAVGTKAKVEGDKTLGFVTVNRLEKL